MGREIKRVALDFDWPLNKVWEGFLSPDSLDEIACPNCEGGYSARAKYLKDLWYGYVPFRPEDNGSVPLTPETPVVRAFAERNVKNAPEFYGTTEWDIYREANLLADLWNSSWSHHLNPQDIADLLAAEGEPLRDLTLTWTRADGWTAIDPPVIPTVEQVSNYMITSFGSSSICYYLVEARCKREGVSPVCEHCDGHGSFEAYSGQRQDREDWEGTEPPAGEGWQLWETVSEGSPISPVFATAEELAQWLTTPAACWGAMKDPMTIETARGFVGVGWAPSMIGNAGGIHEGAEYVGTEAALQGNEALS